MKIKSTKAAFLKMLEEPAINKRLGVSRGTVTNWKAYVRNGNSISLDKMEEMLIKSGATVVSEKVWKL